MTIFHRTSTISASRPERAATATAPEAVINATGALVEMSAVSKTYATGHVRVPALRSVSLSVNRGEMVAIMGPSGCGKTTLLNCISGLDVVDQGSVRIAGTDLSAMSDNARTSYRARHMGFIFQTYNLLPVLSAVENVELPLVVSGMSPGDARKRALAALDRVGLSEIDKQRPAQLTGGQRQRVTIARALVNEPAIVWADEPTGALDSRTADDVMNLIEELNVEQNLTVVIVTHDSRVAARCHRIVRMRDGVIVMEEAGK